MAKEKYDKHYNKSSRMYLAENDTERSVDIIIDNSDFNNLKIIKNNTILGNKE